MRKVLPFFLQLRLKKKGKTEGKTFLESLNISEIFFLRHEIPERTLTHYAQEDVFFYDKSFAFCEPPARINYSLAIFRATNQQQQRVITLFDPHFSPYFAREIISRALSNVNIPKSEFNLRDVTQKLIESGEISFAARSFEKI